MDDSFVRSHVEHLRYLPEETSGLEITLHTVSLIPACTTINKQLTIILSIGPKV
jgi:hypothetical protein